MSNKFTYNSTSSVALMSTQSDGSCAFYAEVTVLWGDLLLTEGFLPADQQAPVILPNFPENIVPTVTRNQLSAWDSSLIPGSPIAKMLYLGKNVLYGANGSVRGVRFVYTSGDIVWGDSNPYVVQWQYPGFSIAYGPDEIVLGSTNGVSDIFGDCD